MAIIRRIAAVKAQPPAKINEAGQMLANNIKWHYEVAKEFYKLGLMGFKCWHKEEAKTDSELLADLSELTGTSFVAADTVAETAEDGAEISFNIKEHFSDWLENESKLYSLVEEILKEELSDEWKDFLEELAEEADSEKKHVQEVLARLTFTNFLPLDLANCSAAMHIYFKVAYKEGSPICFIIG